jgi:wyosine [tRNA(Phe)-imidazoG37] synthetase (radical SAM superfamily)
MYQIRLIDRNGQPRISRPITALDLERIIRRIERIAESYSIEYFVEYPL